jgi:hypothetical protein
LSVMFIDPSGQGKDETAYATVSEVCGNMFCSDVGGYTGGYDDATLRALAMAAKSNRVGLILVEKNFGGGMFTSLLTPHIQEVYRDPALFGYVAPGCNIEEIHSTGQKELRIIETLEPLMNQHRLVVDRGVFLRERRVSVDTTRDDNLTYRLSYQLTRVTKDRGSLAHDDRLEALAGACRYLAESMAKDRGAAVDEYKRSRVDAEREAYIKELNSLRDSYGVSKPTPEPNLLTYKIRQRNDN